MNSQTLRYYERRGLLGATPRATGGHRDYPEAAVHLLRFVKRAQQLGLRSAARRPQLPAAPTTGEPDEPWSAPARTAVLTAECSCNPACPIPFAVIDR